MDSPLDLDPSSTVSRGVVSALRTGEPGHPMIQADASIHGGNGGGAPVDANGNVAGITVAGIMANAQSKIGAGLNFFIPLDDALKKPDVVLADQGPGRKVRSRGQGAWRPAFLRARRGRAARREGRMAPFRRIWTLPWGYAQ